MRQNYIIMNNRKPEIPKHPDSIPGRYFYRYPRPSVASDCVIFGFDGSALKLLLVERGQKPFLGAWALPGGFLHQDETIEECAARELREETNLRNVYMEQFKVYSNPDRDPRGRVISIAFIALVRPSDYNVIAGDDASKAFWFKVDELPPLAFDHQKIVREARERLKEILILKPIAFNLLNKYFSLGELQRVYEVINDTTYDRRNFTRSVQEAGIVEPTDVKPQKARNRPPRLYQANQNLFGSDSEIITDAEWIDIDDLDELPTPPAPLSDNDGTDQWALFNQATMPQEPEEKEMIIKESPTKGLFNFLGLFNK